VELDDTYLEPTNEHGSPYSHEYPAKEMRTKEAGERDAGAKEMGKVVMNLSAEAVTEVPEYLTVEAEMKVAMNLSEEVVTEVLEYLTVEAVLLLEARAGITWGNWDRKSRRS